MPYTKILPIPYIGKEGDEDLGLQIFEEVCMMREEEEKHIGTFGLGYTPTQAEMIEMKEKMRKRKTNKAYNPTIEIPHIRDSFLEANHIQ